MKKAIFLVILFFNIFPTINNGKFCIASPLTTLAQSLGSEQILQQDDGDGNGTYCILETTVSGPIAGPDSDLAITVCDEEVDCDNPTTIISPEGSSGTGQDCTTTIVPGIPPPCNCGSADGSPEPSYTGEGAIPPPPGGISMPIQGGGPIDPCTWTTTILNKDDADEFLFGFTKSDTDRSNIENSLVGAANVIAGALYAEVARERAQAITSIGHAFDQKTTTGLVITMQRCKSPYGTAVTTYFFSTAEGEDLGNVSYSM